MSDSQNIKYLKLVVASPSDVGWERNEIVEIVRELNPILRSQWGLELDVLRWETDANPGFHPEGIQGRIDETLKITDCDIMIGVFWKRFGSPTKGKNSGTEYELDLAYNSWKNSGQRRPHTMIYFNKKKYQCKSKDEEDQLGKVTAYERKISAVALPGYYSNRVEFKNKVRGDLFKYLLDNLGSLGARTFRIIETSEELLAVSQSIVRDAEKKLYITGSRSRDLKYLQAIEERLRSEPNLVLYRVLFGIPHRIMLKDHLLRLLHIRDPNDRSIGQKSIHLGLFKDYGKQSETFILGNEKAAIVPLPFNGVGEYSSGIFFTGAEEIDKLDRFVREIYKLSEKIETISSVSSLACLETIGEKDKPSEEVQT